MNPNAPVPQSEDSAMQWQQLPAAYPIFYLPPSQPRGDQLSPGDDAVLPLGQIPNRTRRLKGRRNAFCAQWTDKALHRRFVVFAWTWGHALSGRWMDRTLHLGSGGSGHGETVAGGAARVARSALRLTRSYVTEGPGG